MDKFGIDLQVLSLTAPGVQMQPDTQIAVSDARAANDYLAAVISEYPTRFQGLAAVPLQDPRQAAAELRRAVEDLGLCGALVNDHTLGHYLDEPQYEPFWETLQDLGVPARPTASCRPLLWLSRPQGAKATEETALGVLRDEHRNHHVRRVLAPGANRRGPDDRRRQRDVLD